jgi:hypothetical protein
LLQLTSRRPPPALALVLVRVLVLVLLALVLVASPQLPSVQLLLLRSTRRAKTHAKTHAG